MKDKNLNGRRKVPMWLKSGIIFFLISLISAILVMVLCSSITDPEGGCSRFFGSPFLSYWLFFDNLYGFHLVLIGIVGNTIIGIIFGLIIEYLFKIKNMSIFFALLIVVEIIMLTIGRGSIVFFILTLIFYILYLIIKSLIKIR